MGEKSIGNHEEIGASIGGVGTENEAVESEIRVSFRVGLGGRRRDPLDGERRPFKRVRNEEIVEKWSVLLPY